MLCCFALAGCYENNMVDPKLSTVQHVLIINLPYDIKNPKVENLQALLTNVQTKQTYKAHSFTLKQNQLVDTLTLPQGIYHIKVSGDLSYHKKINAISTKYKFKEKDIKVNAKVKTERENIPINNHDNNVTKLSLTVYKAKNGFVITEIYFTGSTTIDGKMYTDDQYIKIGNNSDSVMYADGLAFIESFFTSDDLHDYQPNIMDKAMTINTIYVIPGRGKDVPVKPGEELTIALTAEDHTKINPNSIDLSKADFEIYDKVTDPEGDHDVPGVPNLDNWYGGFEGCFAFHTRGVKSYAIAKPLVDKKTYMTKFRYRFGYIFRQGDYVIPMNEYEYYMPNDWIIDAVNLSVPASFAWLLTSPSLDKGYTYCGHVDFDESRYSHAVVRKREHHHYVEKTDVINNKLDKWVVDEDIDKKTKWIDTNNSTEDFVPNAQPSYFARKRKK